MPRKPSFKTIIKRWEKLKTTERNSRTAKEFAKAVGRKSMFEVYMEAAFQDMKKNGLLKEVEYEAETWEYQHLPQNYTVDWRITRNDGSQFYVEGKGKMTNEVWKKMKSVQRCNPDKELYMLFERPQNKIRSGSKTTYEQHANRRKLPAVTIERFEEVL